jgi:DNA-directed RNA polymerase specialized sigma24 family protein
MLLEEINRLPKRQHEAIFLRFYEELSYEDIAAIMNLNYQGARNIIYKSVKALRKNMEHKWPHILFPILFLSSTFLSH